MVLPILFIPATLIGSLSLVLIPELSQDLLEKNYQRLRKNILRSLRFALLVACALMPFFYALGDDIGKIAFSNAEAGIMIRKSCPILLPMCLTMISTSMLNSLGYEKHTFSFYFIGAAAMLLSVLFLPSVFGGYAYVIGLCASFVLTGCCNLVLLFKKCNIFQKARGQVRTKDLFMPLIAVLPLSLFGQFCNNLFKGIFGETSAFLLSAICLFAVLFLTYVLCGVLPIKNAFLKRRQSMKKGATKNRVQVRF